jgi:hypothetical protein
MGGTEKPPRASLSSTSPEPRPENTRSTPPLLSMSAANSRAVPPSVRRALATVAVSRRAPRVADGHPNNVAVRGDRHEVEQTIPVQVGDGERKAGRDRHRSDRAKYWPERSFV